MVWTYGENGNRMVGNEDNGSRCERYEVERKTMNEMDEWCEMSVE